MWADMTDHDRKATLHNMLWYGGGFAGHIAEAWFAADRHNDARLAAAFPDLVEKYHPKNWSSNETRNEAV